MPAPQARRVRPTVKKPSGALRGTAGGAQKAQRELEDAILRRAAAGRDALDRKRAEGVKIVKVPLGSTSRRDFPRPWTRKEGGRSVARGAAEWYVPDGADTSRRMLYFHGGSFVTWQPQDLPYRSLGTRLAKACGVCVLSIDYRNAPECLFPAAFDDCVAALDWVASHGPGSTTAESPARDLFVCGDSAGGTLALGVCVDPPPSVRGLLRGVIGISAWTDMTASLPSYDTRMWDPERCFGDATNAHCRCRQDGRDEAEGYLGRGGVERQGRDWRASPFFTPAARLCAMPAVLLHVGDFELLLDDSVQLQKKMVKAGHRDATCSVYPRMWHVWHQYSEGGGERAPLQKALLAVLEIGQWVTARKS